jgi:hypothetical protein
MDRKVFGAAMIVLSLMLVIAAAPVNLYAIDGDNRFFAYGLGQRTCADYVKIRERKLEELEAKQQRLTKDELYDIVERISEHWIAGFLTASNLLMADTYDVAGRTNINDLKARLETICRADEKQRFAQAMVVLVKELTPQRVKADAGK